MIPLPSSMKENEQNTPRILGWDAAGEVIEAGSDCTLFKKGDAVYYAASISRPLGTNCEFHLVHERIVGSRPGRHTTAEKRYICLGAYVY
jgi:NADPH:quinone reductase